MELRQMCFYLTVALMLGSAAYLLFLALALNLTDSFKLKFFTFMAQHVFSIIMLIRRKVYDLTDEA